MDSISNAVIPKTLNTTQDVNLIREANLTAKNAKVSAQTKPVQQTELQLAEERVKPTDIEVEHALAVVNKAAVFEQRSLIFTLDEDSGRTIVTVVDKSTEQVIRQIPTEELLKVSQDIKKLQQEMDQSLGLLFNRTV